MTILRCTRTRQNKQKGEKIEHRSKLTLLTRGMKEGGFAESHKEV